MVPPAAHPDRSATAAAVEALWIADARRRDGEVT